MKTLKRIFSFIGVSTLMFALTGCLESTDVIFFEPGVYQGSSDPLIGNSDAAALQSRFEGQMDR
jgi:hypothetical protein